MNQRTEFLKVFERKTKKKLGAIFGKISIRTNDEKLFKSSDTQFVMPYADTIEMSSLCVRNIASQKEIK